MVNFNLDNLANSYDSYVALDAKAQKKFLKGHWMQSDGQFKVKTVWGRFLASFCCTKRFFHDKHNISLYGTEKNLFTASKDMASVEDEIKTAKNIYLLELFKQDRCRKNPEKLSQRAISATVVRKMPFLILLLNQLQAAENELKKPLSEDEKQNQQVVLNCLNNQVKKEVQAFLQLVIKSHQDMDAGMDKIHKPRQKVSYKLIKKFCEVI